MERADLYIGAGGRSGPTYIVRTLTLPHLMKSSKTFSETTRPVSQTGKRVFPAGVALLTAAFVLLQLTKARERADPGRKKED